MKRLEGEFNLECEACRDRLSDECTEDSIEFYPAQTRTVSAIEATLNVLIGLIVAFTVQITIFPWFGILINTEAQLSIAMIFTAVSIIRSYGVRRFFVYLHLKELL